MSKTDKITINDVAREAGVSITTVSRYLNHQYKYMSEETRQKITEVVKELNYRPNPLAQGLKSRSHTVAIVVTNLDYPLCISVTRELFSILNEKGFNLLVCETAGDTEREANIFRSLSARSVDGIVIQTGGLNNDYLREISAQTPIVFFDREYDLPYSVNLVTNNRESSEKLTLGLFEEGYDDILYLTEELCSLSTRVQRLEGYQAACRANRKEPWVVTVNHNNPETFPPAIEALKSRAGSRKIAVYTANGLIMLKIYPYLKKTGLSVPGEMGLASFDEPNWAKIMTPPLTCISQPTEAIGQSAAIALLKSIKSSRKTAASKTQVINSSIIMRGSTALARASEN